MARKQASNKGRKGKNGSKPPMREVLPAYKEGTITREAARRAVLEVIAEREKGGLIKQV